jgi:hypothetical protein
MNDAVSVKGVHLQSIVLLVEMSSLSHVEGEFSKLAKHQVLVCSLFEEQRTNNTIRVVSNL